MDIIRVKAADPTRVAAFERHPAHPGGECWVTGDGVHQVAATPYILNRIAGKHLILVSEENEKPPSARKSKRKK